MSASPSCRAAGRGRSPSRCAPPCRRIAFADRGDSTVSVLSRISSCNYLTPSMRPPTSTALLTPPATQVVCCQGPVLGRCFLQCAAFTGHRRCFIITKVHAALLVHEPVPLEHRTDVSIRIVVALIWIVFFQQLDFEVKANGVH